MGHSNDEAIELMTDEQDRLQQELFQLRNELHAALTEGARRFVELELLIKESTKDSYQKVLFISIVSAALATTMATVFLIVIQKLL